jgi:hypothetical protein
VPDPRVRAGAGQPVLLGGLVLDGPLSTLPALTKSLLMENFDELVTARDVRLDAVEEYLAGLRGDELFRDR